MDPGTLGFLRVDNASPSVAAKITPPAVCSGGMQHITLYVLPVIVVMNHLHNRDRCRIVSGRQKKIRRK